MELFNLDACRLAELVRSREISAVESVRACLERIEALNGAVNAFVHVCAERALSDARRQDEAIARGEDPGPLAGVPFGVKDLEDVKDLPTTFGSVPFKGNIARNDSVQVARLRAAGAICVGKTNTPEFGYTAFTRNLVFGVSRNPWNLERTPGGSSGGSAAAIAARMVPLATASDGGGSIRIPASYVGAFGMKPTFGRIPHGPEPLGMIRWVDTVCYGPLTRTVEDAALFLDVTAGYDPHDPTSLPAPAGSYRESLAGEPSHLRIAYSNDLGYAIVQADVLREVESALDAFRELGHEVERVDLSLPDLGRGWAYMVGAENYAEIATLVAGKEDELGRSFWSGLQAAGKLTPLQQGEFQRERYGLNSALATLFGRYDLLLTPTMPTEAFGATGPLPSGVGERHFESPMHIVAFTFPFNLSGHPAATVRAGMTDAGLPAGLQIVAERHRDELVLQAARAYEKVRPCNEWPQLDGVTPLGTRTARASAGR
jgi:aspartyl-tRNA(Asn)/glutamyl-tRNA(Gln) amidotransferase subunit A